MCEAHLVICGGVIAATSSLATAIVLILIGLYLHARDADDYEITVMPDEPEQPTGIGA